MTFSSSYLLSITTFIYLGAAALYLIHWVFRVEKVGLLASVVTLAGLVCQTVGIGLRWVESYQLGYGHAPLSNLYESLVFFAWVTVLVYLIIEYKTKKRVIGAFATPFATLAMAYASFSPDVQDKIQPLIPALQSNWLIAHVITCFLGYASFVALRRYYYRGGMGQSGMGHVLELGPQGDMVSYYLVRVCHSPACEICARLAG